MSVTAEHVQNEVARAPRFQVGFARNTAEVQETQRLRYRIFGEEMGAQLKTGDLGIDADHYDPYCRHLMVRELEHGRVIACTRVLTDDRALDAGGFYSAGEFDIEMVNSLPGQVMEIGRTCVDAEYRSGGVIALLWQGIAEFITREGYDYLFGCASIGLEDGGAKAHAILETLRAKYTSPAWHRVRPYNPLPAADARPTTPVKMPPLLKAYVSLGAKACGEAYWDRDFNCADVFMLLNVPDLNPRYARHFLEKQKPADESALSLA